MIHPDVLNTVSLEFSAIARTKSKSGQKLFSLGLGEPFWQAPQPVREKLAEVAMTSHYGYTNPFGNPELRQLVAQDVQSACGGETSSDQILITAGAKQALSIVLKTILEDGDEVLVVDPCFVSYRPQVLLANHNARVIPCPLAEDFSVDFAAIEARLTRKTKAFIVNTPNNPSGGLISEQEMSALVELAREAGIYLICDEIYRNFVFQGAKFVSATPWRREYDKIITVDGFSKTFGMTGWRLGYVVASPEFIALAVKVIQHELTNVPEILQIAACEAFRLPENWFEQYRSVLEKNARYFSEKTAPIPVLRTPPVRAGMFCFPKFDLPEFTSDSLAVKLLNEQSVAVTPGVAFGPDWDNYLRVSLSSKHDDFREAIDRLTFFFGQF